MTFISDEEFNKIPGEPKRVISDADFKNIVEKADPNNPTTGIWDALKKGLEGARDAMVSSGNELADVLATPTNNVAGNFAKTAKASTTLIKAPIKIASELALETPLRVAGEVAQDITGMDINEAVARGTQKLVEKGLNSEIAQKAMNKWAELKQTDPESAMALGAVMDIGDIAANVVGLGTEKVAATALKQGLEKTAVKGGEIAAKGIKESGNMAAKGGEVVKDTIKTIADKTNVTDGLNKVSDAITPFDKGLENELTKTPAQHLNEYIKQAEDAVMDYSKPTPLELAGKKAEMALKNINDQLKAAGETKSNIVKSIAETQVGDIAAQARQKMKDMVAERLGTTFTEDGFQNAAGRVSKISDKADKQMLDIANRKLAELGTNPSFAEIDDTIGYMQDLLYKRGSNLAIPVNKQVEGILKNVVGELKSNLKTIGGQEYSAANSQYQKLINVRNSLNKALGNEGSKGGALMKKVFSPSDGGTKELFNKVKALTGHDLVKEATLAKFVMEHVGDSRQSNLLEEVFKGNIGTPTSSRGILQKGIEWGASKLQDPIGKARRLSK